MNFRKIGYYIVIALSVLVILASLLSLFYNLPYWYSKLLDFPRVQYLILGIIFLIIFLIMTRKWNWPASLLALGLISAILIQSIKIFPYWFGEKTVPDAAQNYPEENAVSVLLANVLIENKKAGKFLKVAKDTDADIMIVMEVNDWWLDALEPLKDDYEFVVEQPNDEAYGMAIYSRLAFKNVQKKYIKHKNVPSYHIKIALESGKEFMLHAVHPVAPMPSDKYPDNVGDAEIELVRVGEMVAAESLPAMVAGDFNDVSWSNTSRLFEEDGELNNVRLGRGLFNTFDANSSFMRWPLDHYFVSKEFQLVEIKLLDKIGSDHFPIYAKFVIN
ncbi:MAG: endonuclease/exonuclease/phosphatase family protein [Gramella sp.]|nr:endonuclease/exonuclease/phosphatase family protein [Christiangramia sp.]